MVRFLMGLLSLLPLRVLRGLGAWVGRWVYRLDKNYAQNIANNASRAGYVAPQFWLSCAEHIGRGGAELVHLWTPKVQALIPKAKVVGWESVLELQKKNKGILMLTPHLGSFELLSLWIGAHTPFVAMYRAPKRAAIEPIMLAGRERYQVQMATADVKGIRVMLRHLKQGGMVGLLPDQTPANKDDAAIADMFGEPAMTMTLPAKLLRQTGAGLVVMFAKRVDAPHQFELYFEVVEQAMTGTPEVDARTINALMERLISLVPEQYLWSYNRHKGMPKSVPNPAMTEDA